MWSNNHFDRYFIGLDRIAERMSTLAQETQKAVSNYPPYNLKKIDDNTAENVEIIIQLAPNVSPDQTIDALYAFTNCEVSVSPNSCVIDDGKPRFIGVKELLNISTENTLNLLKKELEIRKEELL